MNMIHAKAKVCWLHRPKSGSTTVLPRSSYTAPAQFEEEADKWPDEAWSLAVAFDGASPTEETPCVTADVSFLIEDGPVYLLHAGRRFELYEGRWLVARGEVISG